MPLIASRPIATLPIAGDSYNEPELIIFPNFPAGGIVANGQAPLRYICANCCLEAPYLSDSFFDWNGTLLTSHVPDNGPTWAATDYEIENGTATNFSTSGSYVFATQDS